MALKGWRDVPIGGVIAVPGSSVEYKTGGWRSHRPNLDRDKCNNCMLCWLFCPDSSIGAESAKITEFDWDHCKGCGICAEVCPIAAINMVEEASVE